MTQVNKKKFSIISTAKTLVYSMLPPPNLYNQLKFNTIQLQPESNFTYTRKLDNIYYMLHDSTVRKFLLENNNETKMCAKAHPCFINRLVEST